MGEHRATIEWQRGEAEFTYETYPRHHLWIFEGGERIDASAAPAYRGDPKHVDPEEAFVASIASCHMLTLLAILARKGVTVNRYRDEAVGWLEKNAEGRLAITRVVLRPRLELGAGESIPADELERLHDNAHHHCFIANSVRTEIVVEAPRPAGPL